MAMKASIWILVWSLAISALVTTSSVLGLVDQGVYDQKTKNWATQAKGQDIGNLFAVVTLLVSGYGYHKGSHRSALVWLGALFYLAYAYVVYSMAVHFNELFLVYVATLGLSLYAVMLSVNGLRSQNEDFPQPAARVHAGCTAIAISVFRNAVAERADSHLTFGLGAQERDRCRAVGEPHSRSRPRSLAARVGIVGYLTLKGKAAGLFLVAPLLTFSVLMGGSIVAAMALMTVDGLGNTLPPLLMISLVVLASLFAAWRYLVGSYNSARG